MPQRQPESKISAATVARMASEFQLPLGDKNSQVVAVLLQALYADMSAVRKMNVGEAEPAVVYDAGATES